MHSKELAVFVQDALDAMKARDIRALEVSRLTSITDFMIIASGTSDRHVRAIADRVIELTKAADCPAIGVEGLEHGEWVLVDLDDVVLHIMQPRIRDFYKLENLWDMDIQDTVVNVEQTP